MAESSWMPLFRTIFGPQTKPRRIAVIIAVSKYLGLTDAPKDLAAAKKDSDALISAFEELRFEEIIKITDENFSPEVLERVFKRYLSPQLKEQQNSQLLIAFSGHGNEFESEGYLLLPTGKQLRLSKYEDTLDGWLSMRTFKDLLYDSIRYARQSLILINACKSGTFVAQRQQFGDDVMANPTAQVITAAGPKDLVAVDPTVGSFGGSVFFEIAVAALKNVPLRTSKGPIPPPTNEGILTFWSLFSFLHETTLLLYNRTIAPIPASFMSKTQPPDYDGSFFFVIDEEKAKKTLSTMYPANFRTVFGDATVVPAAPKTSPDYSALVQDAAKFQILPFDIEGGESISSSGDWTFFKRKSGDRLCFMESMGNDALNARFESKQRGKIRQVGEGKESKLRLVFDAKSRQYFMFYVTKKDKSSDYHNLILSPHVVEAIANHYGTPTNYSHPGTLLFYQSDNIVGDFRYGDYISVEGFTSFHPREVTDRVLRLSAASKSYLRSRLKSSALLYRILPGFPAAEDNPKLILAELKRSLKLFGRPFADAQDDDIQRRARLEGLSDDDIYSLSSLTDEDLLPLIAEISTREQQFNDQISLWGFTVTHSAMQSSCFELPKLNIPAPEQARPAPAPSGTIRPTSRR